MATIKLPPLREDQLAIKEHDARFKVVSCGRRWGKTTLGVLMALERAMQGGNVWWVAPDYARTSPGWDLLNSFYRFVPVVERVKSERVFRFPGGGYVQIRSADDPDSLRGAGLDLVVVDEAAFMRAEAWNAALRPALSDRHGGALLISTPNGKNWFYHAFLRGKDPENEDWCSWTRPTADNPKVEKADIAEAEDSIPAYKFRQEYLAAFIEGGGDVFRGVEAASTAPEGMSVLDNHRYVMGVDFGRHNDYTVCSVIDQTTQQQVYVERFNMLSWARQRAKIANIYRRWGVFRMLAELNAMGEPNIEALRGDGLNVEGFNTQGASKPQLIEDLVVAIENQQVALLPDEAQMAELQAYSFSVTPAGHFRYSAPQGLHDDTVIALALAWRLAKRGSVGMRISAQPTQRSRWDHTQPVRRSSGRPVVVGGGGKSRWKF